jgi:copper chaperone
MLPSMIAREFRVPGMSCAHCVAAVEAEVAQVPGVTSVVADLETKLVRVKADAPDEAAVRAAIHEAGYEAE